MVKAIIFDWGDTLMRDLPNWQGPMAFWPEVEIVDGVTEALEALAPSLVCCVASNAGASDAELMGLALERGGIRANFHHLFTSKELGAVKPDSRFFTEALQRIGVAPNECVMVGNDYEKDIAGAKQAGLHTVWLVAGASVPAESGHADYVIRRMDELPGVIRRLVNRA
jgi:FMN phosphatase YigB (HAD superfamily)